ncbi:MAG TPA: helix-turn-helix domain-containing protein [Actinocrinis sp.]|nr:helix-turn-helix domain-containing protein [Actinocrinis sp.]
MSTLQHDVVFMAVAPVMTHDLSVAQSMLGEAGPSGRPAYRVRVATADPGLVARPAHQPQFVRLGPFRRTDRSFAATRAWAQSRLESPLALADLAAHASVSERTFTRRFREETGLSPQRWLLHQRIDVARQLLETTELTMDRIAQRSGLGGPDSLRRHFVAALGVTPSGYRTGWRETGRPDLETVALPSAGPS